MPSRHRCDSFPSDEVVAGFFFEFEAVRTEPRCSAQALTQRKEYDSVINERDILGAQLIRRNDEIGLLQEKLKIQHSTLTRGEEQYSARVHDVQVLRLKIRDMQREVAVASGGAQLSDDLRRDLLQCRRDLLEEKAKRDLGVPSFIHGYTPSTRLVSISQ